MNEVETKEEWPPEEGLWFENQWQPWGARCDLPAPPHPGYDEDF